MEFNHHPQVLRGVEQEEAGQLLKSFFERLRREGKDRPKWKKPQSL
jgi:hypothetical protein